MSKISDLLTEYGNSLEDVKKLVGQLPDALDTEKQNKIAAATTQFYTASEAKKQFGIDLPSPDYLLKMTPDQTRDTGYRFSYVTPSNYEIHDDNTLTTPQGENLSWEDFQQRQDRLKNAINPTGKGSGYQPTQSTQGQLEPASIPNRPSFGGQGHPLDESLTDTQLQDYENERLRAIFGRVFPQRDIQQLLNFASSDPKGFTDEIIKYGRNSDTETLLRKMFPDITDDEINQLFSVPDPQEQAARKFYQDNFSDITDFQNWLSQNQAEFLKRIQKAGNTPETAAFIKFLMPDSTPQQINSLFADYNNVDKVNETITLLDKILNPGYKADRYWWGGAKDAESVNYASSAARAVTALNLNDPNKLKTIQQRWPELTQDQKQQIASLVIADKNKDNSFASLVADINQIGASNIIAGLYTSPVSSIATPITKQITGQEVKPIEWAVGAAQLALFFVDPLAGLAGKAGGTIAARAVAGGINAAGVGVFTADTVMNWNDMTPGNKIFAVAMDALAAFGAMKAISPDLSIKGALKGDPFGNKARQAVLDAFNKNPKLSYLAPDVDAALDDIMFGIENKNANMVRRGGKALQEVGAKMNPEDGGTIVTQRGRIFADNAVTIAEPKGEFNTSESKTPDGELPIGTEIIDYGNNAEKFTITRYYMDSEGNWVVMGKNKDGEEFQLSKDIDPVSGGIAVKKPKFDMSLPKNAEPQMSPGTSVQTGLPGMGSEAAQSKMFGESNTAAGQGGKKQPIIDAEALKKQQANKPLEGQGNLPEPKPKKPLYNAGTGSGPLYAKPPERIPISEGDVATIRKHLETIDQPTPFSPPKYPLDEARIKQIAQNIKQEYLPKSITNKIVDAYNKGDIDTLNSIAVESNNFNMEYLIEDLINELEAPDNPTRINDFFDITNIDKYVEDKYGKLPQLDELDIDPGMYEDIYGLKAKPQDIDKYLSGLKGTDLKNAILNIEHATADISGELASTYRYESIPEGAQIERYMDSILEVTQKYRQKINMPPAVDLNGGTFADHPVTQALAGEGVSVPVNEIKVDPARFQFKGNVDTATGVTTKLEGAQWNPTLGGITYGWEDKAGNIWIVNGHHRLDLAKRSGAKSIRMIIDKETDGVTDLQARTNGALINIAEDQGTALDVAKFLRDSGKDISFLQQFGIASKSKLATRGAAIAQLDDSLFQKVISGQLDEETAVAIGTGLPGDFANQREVAKIASSQDLTPKQLTALIKEAKYAGSTKVSQMTLFGETVEEKSLLVARAKLRAWIEDELNRDRRLFGFVTGKGRPEALSKGGTQVDVAKGQELAQNSATAQTIFEAKVNAVGKINDIINEAATKIVQGGDFNAIRKATLEQIRDTISSGEYSSPPRSADIIQSKAAIQQGLPEGKAAALPETGSGKAPEQPAQQSLISQIEKSIDENSRMVSSGDISALDEKIQQAKGIEPANPVSRVTPEDAAKMRAFIEKNPTGPVEPQGKTPEQVNQSWQNLQSAGTTTPPEPPTFNTEAAHTGIINDVQHLYNNIDTQVKSYRQYLKGLKGDEAKSVRLTLNLLEKELANAKKVLDAAATGIKPKTPQTNLLKRMISTQTWYKGIPAKQFAEIKMKAAGMASMSQMTETQLQKVLDAVTKTRPVKIKGKAVISRATEMDIQALNKSLIDQGKINPSTLIELQHYLNLPTDRYLSGNLFISETEGRQLLNALNQEAEIGMTETQNKIKHNLQSQPALKAAIDDISSRMYADSGKGKVGGNPWIDFGKEMYRIQKKTSSKLGDLWRMAYDKNLENGVALTNMDKDLESLPGFQAIARDKDALQRINDYIASKNKWSDVPEPRNISPDEIRIAQKIEQQFMQFQNNVRYHRVYEAYYEFNGDPQLMLTKIKDAPIEDLREAVKAYETRGAAGLADYLKTKSWGIIESGYEPHIVVNPKLQLNKIKATVVSKNRLQSREGVEFDPSDRNILQRRETYIKQMLNLNLEPIFKSMDRDFQKIRGQLKDPSGMARGIELAVRELRGYPMTEIPAKWIMKTQGYAFSTLALSPHMTVRNVLQVLLQPNLQSLIKTFRRRMTETETRFFEAFVSQETGVTKDYLMQEGMGTDRVSRMVQKVSYYGKAETLINRGVTFRSSLLKAETALKAYEKTGNIKDFISHSGLTELTIEDQKNVLDLLAQNKVDYGIEGLKDVDGGQAAIMQLARKLTEKTHFVYQRSGRARIEMGTSGRLGFSLFTYPRNFIARMVEDVSKLKSGTPAERLNTARNFTSLIAACFIADYIYQKVTGKDQMAYNPLTVLSYTPGGLAMGVVQDIGTAANDLYNVATGDPTAKAKAITDITRLGDMFIPFYKSTMDILEASTNQKTIDKEALNWIRSQFDQKYNFDPHANDVNRKWYESVQHALFGGGDIPLSPEETIQQKINNLGQPIGDVGSLSINQPSVYDMKALYSDLTGKTPEELKKSGNLSSDRIKAGENKSQMDSLPGSRLINLNGDSNKGDTYRELFRQWQSRSQITDPKQLAEFDKTYPNASRGNLTRRQYDLLEQYNALPGNEKAAFLKEHPDLNQNPQDEWLKTHPEENARLAIWGIAKVMTQEAYDKALQMVKDLDIPDSAIKGYLPPAEVAKAYFEYNDAASQWGSSSPEAKLIKANNPKLTGYLNLNPEKTPIPVLEIQVKNRDLADQYSNLPNANTKADFLKTNSEYAKDLKRIDAYYLGLPDNQVDTYADYYTQDLKGYDDDWYLQEHPDFYQMMVDKGIWKEKDFSKIPTRQIFSLYQKYEALPTSGDDRNNFRLQNPDLDAWLVKAKGLKPAQPKAAQNTKTPAPVKLPITEKIQNFQKQYYALPLGTPRNDFRRANPEFDQWLIQNMGFKPLPPKTPEKTKTTTTKPTTVKTTRYTTKGASPSISQAQALLNSIKGNMK